METPKLWTKNFIMVALTTFLVFTSFYFMLVTLPLYSLQELHGKGAEAGLLSTVFLISAIIARPLTGMWFEKVGKSVVFLTSLALLFIASLLYFFTETISTLLLLRFFHGIGFGMATTAAGTIVADIIPSSRRGEGMGYYGLTMNLAMVIGPFLGLFVYQHLGIDTLFSLGALFALFALSAGFFLKIPHAIQTNSSKTGFRFGDLFEKRAIPISIVAGLFALVYSSIISFVSVYAKEIGVTTAASYFFVVYAIVLLLSRPFTGKWFDRYGANVIIYPALLVFASGTLLLSFSSSGLSFLIAAALIGLGWGTVFPSLQTIAIQVAPPNKRGVATATFLSIFDFGFGFGSFIFGLAVAQIQIGSLYFFSTFIILFGILVYFFLHGRRSRQKSRG